MSELGKTYQKIIKKTKKQKVNVQLPNVNKKNQSLKMKILFEQKTMPNMNYSGIGKMKKSDPESRKNSKHLSEIATCDQKSTSEKANFCSNIIFLSLLHKTTFFLSPLPGSTFIKIATPI